MRTKRKAHHGRKTKRQHSRNRRGGMFKQLTSFLTGKKPSSSVGSEVGSESGSERVSMNDAIKLIRTSVVGRMDVQFYGAMHVLTLDKPLVINIPADPKSRQNPITQLRFTVDGDNINVDFVLKNNVFSYCAMARYDDPHVMDTSNLNFGDPPYIRITISVRGQLRTDIIKNNEVSISDTIIPIMDKIQKYANECATDPVRMKLGHGYYAGIVLPAHIHDDDKERILKLFIPSLSSAMSKLSIGKG